MKNTSIGKYQQAAVVDLPNRQWPSKVINNPPAWCSVDLRDGNQALSNPMNIEQKLEMFQLLVNMGFKEIEVGFPAAAEVEYIFVRKLIEDQLIPSDVTIQVLTQTRDHLIEDTFKAIEGVHQAIVHIYNSTSVAQRRVVFNSDKAGIVGIAVQGAEQAKKCAEAQNNPNLTFQYSPESFTGTELDFALEICEEVIDVWEPTPQKPVILNLPATVEVSTPNIFADRIEWFSQNIRQRDAVILSVHTHNDRGTGVAATELSLMAGAERVEGTLFGNGERTGNLDIVTMGLNLYTQGVDPKLDFSNMNEMMTVYQRCTGLPIHPRHPYAGELVYTAFSGSHQDAISKGMSEVETKESPLWDVPYLPMDPQDIGHTYEAIIRINSQSGKGGVAYVMESEFGYHLPKIMHPEFAQLIQKVTEKTGEEVSPDVIYKNFQKEYILPQTPFEVKNCHINTHSSESSQESIVTDIQVELSLNSKIQHIAGRGNGPVDGFCQAIKENVKIDFKIVDYYEHALGQGSNAKAVAYVQAQVGDQKYFGVGIDPNISVASIRAVTSALNRASLMETSFNHQLNHAA